MQGEVVTNPFFKERSPGRYPKAQSEEVREFIVELRKNNYSADDIVVMGQAKGYDIKYNMVYELLCQEAPWPVV